MDSHRQQSPNKSFIHSSADFTIKLNGRLVKCKYVHPLIHPPVSVSLVNATASLFVFVPSAVTPYEVTPDTSLNTYLRTNKQLLGTKFMCLEGGCGVCVVTLRRPHPVTKQTQTIAVNSCLQPILACDGYEIETIEYLKDKEVGYHPIQKRLAEFNGSQCGYCSPAMVMGMYSLLERYDGRVTMDQVENSLGGHICRCTGYRPILDAFKSLAMDAPAERRRNPLTGDIEDLGAQMCLSKPGTRCSQTCSEEQMKKCFHPQDEYVGSADAPHLLGAEWHKSVELKDVFDALAAAGDKKYMLLCGNTAHGVFRRPADIQVFIDVNNVPELKGHAMSAGNKRLEVGGNVTLSEFMTILAECAKSLDQSFAYCTELVKHIALVATDAVRNVRMTI